MVSVTKGNNGPFNANKTKKLFDIDYVALTNPACRHAQSLSRTLSAELKLYELKQGKPMTVKGGDTTAILVGRLHYVHC